MYSIQKTHYGYYLLLAGILDDSEAAELKKDLNARVPEVAEPYSAILDLRQFVPPRSGSQSLLREGFDLAFNAGIERVAIIFSSPIVRDMVKQMAFLSGREPIGRYVDASRTENPEQVALDYIEHGLEPPVTTTQKIRIVAE